MCFCDCISLKFFRFVFVFALFIINNLTSSIFFFYFSELVLILIILLSEPLKAFIKTNYFLKLIFILIQFLIKLGETLTKLLVTAFIIRWFI